MGFFSRKSNNLASNSIVRGSYDWDVLVEKALAEADGGKNTFYGISRRGKVKIVFRNLDNIIDRQKFNIVLRKDGHAFYDDTYIKTLQDMIQATCDDKDIVDSWIDNIHGHFDNVNVTYMNPNEQYNQLIQNMITIINEGNKSIFDKIRPLIDTYETNFPGTAVDLADEINYLMDSFENVKKDLISLRRD